MVSTTACRSGKQLTAACIGAVDRVPLGECMHFRDAVEQLEPNCFEAISDFLHADQDQRALLSSALEDILLGCSQATAQVSLSVLFPSACHSFMPVLAWSTHDNHAHDFCSFLRSQERQQLQERPAASTQ